MAALTLTPPPWRWPWRATSGRRAQHQLFPRAGSERRLTLRERGASRARIGWHLSAATPSLHLERERAGGRAVRGGDHDRTGGGAGRHEGLDEVAADHRELRRDAVEGHAGGARKVHPGHGDGEAGLAGL